MKRCHLIAAVDSKWGIGKNGGIPWYLKRDMKMFQLLTWGKTIVMGSKTFSSLPGPLKHRRSIVLTRQHDVDVGVKDADEEEYQVVFVNSKHEADKMLKEADDYYVIGGKEIYDMYIETADYVHLTLVSGDYGCDVHFPHEKLGPEFAIHEHSEELVDDNIKYRFVTYKRLDTPSKSESSYLSLLEDILQNGKMRNDRTGTGTLSVFGRQLRFDISKSIPALTTKQLAWKTCIKELLWFLKGQTDANVLKKQGVNIWNLNTTRDFLDGRGLYDLPEGDIGAGYGFQWRHFGADYVNCNHSYGEDEGVDQINDVIRQLKEDPYSRRIVVSAWNPNALCKMALPPCHVLFQFYVDDEKRVSCHMYQRSVDCFLGLPFNIFSYATLTYVIAKMCNLNPHELIISTGDTHIYNNHIDVVKEQLKRSPYPLAKLHVNDEVFEKTVDDLTVDDFTLIGYLCHPALKAEMSA